MSAHGAEHGGGHGTESGGSKIGMLEAFGFVGGPASQITNMFRSVFFGILDGGGGGGHGGGHH